MARIGNRKVARKPRKTVVRRVRTGRAKGGPRTVTRTHMRTAPTTSASGVRTPASTSTSRTGRVATKGGLKRSARVAKTTTGTGANRVTKTRRVITRRKNGRIVKRVVTRVNRGGKVTTKGTVKVSGKGPKTTTPKPKRQASAKRSGGTTAPRKRKRK